MRAEGMSSHNALHLGWVGVGHCLTTRRNARVAHQKVDVTELGDDRFDHHTICLGVVDRSLKRRGRTASGHNARNRFGGSLGIAAIVHCDRGAMRCQQLRDTPADASAPTSN